MARWLSWLERRPVTAEVVGSNPIRVVTLVVTMRHAQPRVSYYKLHIVLWMGSRVAKGGRL